MNYIAFIHSDDAGYGISFPDFPCHNSVTQPSATAVPTAPPQCVSAYTTTFTPTRYAAVEKRSKYHSP